MKSPPREIGTAVGRQPHGGKPKTETGITQSSANIQAAGTELCFTWNIPAPDDDHDGLEVYVGGMGDVVLRSLQPYTHTEAIVLHVTEAQTLCRLLKSAIAAADRYRKEME